MPKFNFLLVILYVENQQKSCEFYKKLLLLEPILDVEGMTEFQISESSILGLMPESGIQTILNDTVPNPKSGNQIPRCELYLPVENPTEYLERALTLGAKKVSEEKPRNWGDTVSYCADLDGHILAFAKKTE
jgi:uncharacterized glyoxalase superfamily protein PhnB